MPKVNLCESLRVEDQVERSDLGEMDEVFGREGCRIKISLPDSTMMWIVHRGMDKAHERAQNKEGAIECLTEISKFYELAVMQLEGCLKFVQEETDSSFEISDQEVLGDLAEIRDRLVGRLKESELAIAEKDRELTWRLENEMRLRKALEMKERQLDSLRAKLKLEPTKSGDVEELMFGNQASVDEDRDEEFSGLKHSVDQQVWNIKQKLEPEYKFDKRRNKSCDSLKIKQMDTDIDILKETMDIAFGKMKAAIFMSEMEPVEQQWRLTIEKDALAILIKGFMRDIQESFQAEIRGRQKQVSSGLSKHLSDLIKEMKCLHDELECLCLSESNNEQKNFLKPRGKSPSEEDKHQKSKSYSSRIEKVGQDKQPGKENPEDDGGNYVAKLIKNHESIIKRKNKELNWLKKENPEDKGSSCTRREEDFVSSRKRIQDVIDKMQDLLNWNLELGKNLQDNDGYTNKEGSSTKSLLNFHTTQQEKSDIDDSKVNKTSKSGEKNELHNDIKILKEEKEYANLQTMIMEKTYSALWEGFLHECKTEMFRYELQILIREAVVDEFLKNTVNEWNEQMESYQIDVQIREEIHYILSSEVVKDFHSTLDSASMECQDARAEISCLEDHNLEEKLREDISKLLLREVCKESNEFAESSDAQNLEGRLREDISKVFFREVCKEWNKLAESSDAENMEGKLREDISKVIFREACKEWNELVESSDAENLEGRLREDVSKVFFREICEESKELAESSNEENLEGKLTEDITKVCFRGVCKEGSQLAESSDTENFNIEDRYQMAKFEKILGEIRTTNDHKISKLKEVNLEGEFREEISRFLFGEFCKEYIERSEAENLVSQYMCQESLRDMSNTGNCLARKLYEVKSSENGLYGFPFHEDSFKLTELSVTEDVYMVFLTEMLEEWKKETDAHHLESIIKDEVFLLVLVETVKETNDTHRETVDQDHFRICKDLVSSDKLDTSHQVSEEEIPIDKKLIQSAKSESRECNSQGSLIQLMDNRLKKLKISQELLTEMRITSTSISSKVSQALEQLALSNSIVNELRSCVGVASEDWKAVSASSDTMEPSCLQQKETQTVKPTPPSYVVFIPFMQFSQEFMNFKCIVEEKLELNVLRLEEAMENLKPLANLVSRRRKEGRLYRKAFISRCENLRKAETEVDLLGNQVEELLLLLEKIYNILHYYSPVLQNYFEVSDILMKIRKEIGGENS